MKIAGVQMDVRLGQVQDNLARFDERASEAAGQGAELIVFPECAATGYCFNSLEEARPFAEPTNGPIVATVHELCAKLGVHIVFGYLETDGQNVFNGCACVGPKGLVGSYRKIHLPYLGVDRFVAPGDRPFAVHSAGSLNIGMHICYDASFPESGRLLSLAGADLLVLPTNWPPGAEPTADYVINARSSENKVYSIAVNRVGLERGFGFIGKSRICNVHGESIAEANHRDEAILYAEIDPALARDKRIERVPGQHAIHRFEDRRTDMYGPLLQ